MKYQKAMLAKRTFPPAAALLAAFLLATLYGQDFDISKTRAKFDKGDYSAAAREAAAAVEGRERGEDWRILLIESLLNTGKYPEALEAISTSLRSYSYS